METQAAGDAEDAEAVGDGAAISGGLGEFVVGVDGVIITTEASKRHDVGFGDRATGGLPNVALWPKYGDFETTEPTP